MAQTLHKLTDKYVRNAPIGMHGDGGGLWLQVKGENAASWIFRWRQNGKGRYLGLGPLTSITLAKARNIAAKHREVVTLGGDPAAERDEVRRQQDRQHRTFREFSTIPWFSQNGAFLPRLLDHFTGALQLHGEHPNY